MSDTLRIALSLFAVALALVSVVISWRAMRVAKANYEEALERWQSRWEP